MTFPPVPAQPARSRPWGAAKCPSGGRRTVKAAIVAARHRRVAMSNKTPRRLIRARRPEFLFALGIRGPVLATIAANEFWRRVPGATRPEIRPRATDHQSRLFRKRGPPQMLFLGRASGAISSDVFHRAFAVAQPPRDALQHENQDQHGEEQLRGRAVYKNAEIAVRYRQGLSKAELEPRPEDQGQ